MHTKGELKSINRYNKENTKVVGLRLNNKNDADIIAKLEQVPSKMGYIKELIRKDIRNTVRMCPKCSNVVPDDKHYIFCPGCGFKLPSK